MAGSLVYSVLGHIRRLAGTAAGQEDEILLRQFVGRNDQNAFASLVDRHGPMVLGVCRRMVRDAHLAEDAFQAVFLVLARKAGSIKDPNQLGNWLYGVALRIGRKAQVRNARQEALRMTIPDRPQSSGPATWDDLKPVIDEEVSRLPAKYRMPVVLCYLEGKTNADAARQIGCPEGTVFGRLSRARDLLRGRLIRRGVAPALVAELVSGAYADSAKIPPALMGTLFQAVAGRLDLPGASALVNAYFQESVMLRMKFASLLLAAALTTVGGGWLVAQTAKPAPEGKSVAGAAAPLPEKPKEADQPAASKKVTLFEPQIPPRSTIVHFTPVDDGRRVVVASSTLVQLFDTKSGKELRAFPLGNSMTACVTVSPDEKTLWVGYVDHAPQGWDLNSGKELKPLEDAPGRVLDLSYSRDGRFLVAACMFEQDQGKEKPPTVDCAVCVWDAKTHRRLQRWVTGSGPSNQFGVASTISGDGKRVAAATPAGAMVWDRESGKKLWNGSTPAFQVALTPDGKKLASAYCNNIVQLWNADTGEAIGKIDDLPPGDRSMRSMAISPDGQQLLVSVGDDGVRLGQYFTADCGLHIFDLTSQKKLGHVELNDLFKYGACFTSDGLQIMAATGSTLGSCKVADLLDGKVR